MTPARQGWIGSYSTADATGAITGFVATDSGGVARHGGATTAHNASYLARAESGIVYAVLENDPGEVTAFAVDTAGVLRPLGPPRSTGGSFPCHLTVDPGQRYVLSANYGSGSVAVHPIAADGSLAEATDVVQHHGSGADSGPDGRQAGPHAHMALNRRERSDRWEVLVADLGIDRIARYRLDDDAGRLTAIGAIDLPPGSGPRHLAIEGRYAYVAGELDSALTVVDLDADGGTVLDSVSTVPADERSLPSAIRLSPDGRWCYVANRGPDTIAVLSVDGPRVRLAGSVSTGGEEPRDLALSADGRMLYVANQGSDEVRTFRVDPRTGLPSPVGEPLRVSQPSCVLL